MIVLLYKLSKTDEVWDSKEFKNNEVQFNLLHVIRDGETSYLAANKNKSVIIGQTSSDYPVWIWTSDEITDEEIKELKNDFSELFKEAKKLCCVAKSEIAVTLGKHYSEFRKFDYKIDMEMESFQCPSIIEPKAVKGIIRKANIDDANVISEFLSSFVYDCFGTVTAPVELLDAAKRYCNSGNLYVWCNVNQVISIANLAHRSSGYVRINEVYTRPNMRGKGFAAMLISKICKMIHAENRVPMLYTDLKNPASNKAYKKVGFIEWGKVTQISFDITQ